MEDNILKLPKSLTKDENITLFKKMLNSSKEEAEEIRKNIITGNLRLVVETIKKYRNNVEDQKDLFQIGCIGLIKAVDTFDVTKNMMFSTYATVCISNRVKEYLRKGNQSNIFNLGNGNGYSVKEVIDVARKVTNFDICAVEEPRRSGDPAVLIASSEKAKSVLGWKPEFDSLEKIIEDAWNWHRNNVNGYATVIDNSK